MEMVDAIPRQMETDHDQSEKQLKYLEFVQAAALKAVFCFSNLYDYAKENSGPLKPGVETVEGTVKTVIGPVYHRFHDVPFDLLQFVDRKVDQTVCKLDEQVPPVVKEASTQVISGAHKVASEVQRVGVMETAAEIAKGAYTKCEPVAEELYAKYEPVAEKYAVTAWVALNRLPLFPQVAHIVVPTAAYWSEKYNQAVSYSYGRGYTVASYLPLVPTERIANVFGGGVENGHVEPAQPDETIANSHVNPETFNDTAAAGEVSEGVSQVSK